jgi:hypothetical protein
MFVEWLVINSYVTEPVVQLPNCARYMVNGPASDATNFRINLTLYTSSSLPQLGVYCFMKTSYHLMD